MNLLEPHRRMVGLVAVTLALSSVTVVAVVGASARPTSAQAEQAPRIGAVLEDMVLVLEEPPVVLDLVAGLVGNVRDYGAVSGDPGIVNTGLSGSELMLTPVAEGVTTIAVSAVNQHGSAFQEFQVTVESLGSPRIVQILHELVLKVGDVPAVIDLAPVFTGGALSYGATAADPILVRVEMSGSRIMVTGLAMGTTAINVSATSSVGSALQTIRVQILESGEPAPTDQMTPVTDPAPGAAPEGDGLSADDEALPLVDAAPDGGGQDDGAPAAASAEAPKVLFFLPDRTLTVGDSTVELDVSPAFAGDGLSYSSSAGDPGVVRVEMSGSSLFLTAVGTGVTTVSSRATNAAGAALQSFQVTVHSVATTGGGGLGPPPENPTG